MALAIEFLKEIFESTSSIAAKEIFKLAKTEGYSEITIRRAKKKLGLKSYKDADEDGKIVWYWKKRSKRDDAHSKEVKELVSKFILPKLPFSD